MKFYIKALGAVFLAAMFATSGQAGERRMFSGESLYGAPMGGANTYDARELARMQEGLRNGDTMRSDNVTSIGCQNNVTFNAAFNGSTGTDTKTTQTTTCTNTGNQTSGLSK